MKRRRPALAVIGGLIAVLLLFGFARFLADGSTIEQAAMPASAHHVLAATRWMAPLHGWAAPDVASLEIGSSLPSDWQPVNLPDMRPQGPTWQRTLSLAPAQPAQVQVVWYRVDLPAGQSLTDIYLARLGINGTEAIYQGNTRIWMRPARFVFQPFFDPILIHLDPASGQKPQPIYIRVAARAENGGVVSTLWAAPTGTMARAFYLRTFLQAGIVWWTWSAYWLAAVLSLIVWWRQRPLNANPVYGWFTLLAFTMPTLLLGMLSGGLGEVPEFLVLVVSSLGDPIVMVCLVHFYGYATGQRQRGLSRFVNGLCVLQMCAEAAFFLRMSPHLSITELSSRLMALILPALTLPNLAALWLAFRVNSRIARVLGLLALASAAASVHDLGMLSNAGKAEDLMYMAYCFPIALVVFTATLFGSYFKAIDTADLANEQLQRALAAKEAELNQSHRRLLTIQREQTLAHERQRMMQEMHDGIGASLVSALRCVQHGESDLAVVAQVLEECIDDLKLSIDSLEPTEQDVLQLLSSLRFRLGSRLKGSGIDLHWAVSPLPPLGWLDAQFGMHILRVLQEVMTNLLKHSNANTLRFSTGLEQRLGVEGIAISVEDNGRPFHLPPPETIPAARKGLGNILSRTHRLKGHCAWQVLEAGNRFVLWLPLERPELTGV